MEKYIEKRTDEVWDKDHFAIYIADISKFEGVTVSIANDPEHTYPINLFNDEDIYIFSNYIDSDEILKEYIKSIKEE
jgi:hypothetical protein